MDPEKCKPNTAAFAYLKRYSGSCGKECISVGKKLVVISEVRDRGRGREEDGGGGEISRK